MTKLVQCSHCLNTDIEATIKLTALREAAEALLAKQTPCDYHGGCRNDGGAEAALWVTSSSGRRWCDGCREGEDDERTHTGELRGMPYSIVDRVEEVEGAAEIRALVTALEQVKP